MVRVRPSRIVVVAILALFVFALTQLGSIAYAIINAPSYIGGAVEMPIFQSAMFEYAGETSYHDMP
jgi:hypothetical protein